MPTAAPSTRRRWRRPDGDLCLPQAAIYLYPGADWVGHLEVADIGIAADPGLPLEVATDETVAALLPARPRNSHKGTYGRALVVAGSANYVGAPALAAEAAYRSGAGLVTAALPRSVYPLVAGRLREPTYLVLPDDLGVLTPAAVRLVAGAWTATMPCWWAPAWAVRR